MRTSVLTAVIAALIGIMASACGSQKKMNIGSKDYTDTPEYFYSSYYGTAKNPNAAKNIAKLNCRADLATKINGRVTAAMESYYNQYADEGAKKGMALDESGKAEMNFMSFVEANLGHLVEEVEGRLSAPNRKGEYTYYVVMRVKRSDCAKAMEEISTTLPSEVKAQIDRNQELFRERLNEYLNRQ